MDRLRQYEQIVDSLVSGILALDESGAIIARNAAAARHLGIEESAIPLGSKFDELCIPESFRDVIRKVMADRQPMSRQEIYIRESGGLAKEIGFSVSLLDGDLPFNGAVFLFVDMTERRKLERAAELNRQLAQISGLTAGVVHELRNPLGVIYGMGEMLQEKLEKVDERRRYADVIVQEARRMDTSIAEFLNFAKPFELERSLCEAGSIVERAVELCRHAAAKKHVRLETRCGQSALSLHADPDRIAQAIANLISNAIDAVPENGLVQCLACQDGSHVLFQVKDDGPGIGSLSEAEIFSPFFSRKESGTGLGLAICHRIVTSHGGTVSCANAPDGGAVFSIRMPR